MFGYENSASLFTLIVHDDNMHIANVTVFSLFTLSYFSVVILWSLSKVRLIGGIEGGRRTTPKVRLSNLTSLSGDCVSVL